MPCVRVLQLVTVVLLTSSVASADTSVPDRTLATRDPLGLAGRRNVSGEMIDGLGRGARHAAMTAPLSTNA